MIVLSKLNQNFLLVNISSSKRQKSAEKFKFKRTEPKIVLGSKKLKKNSINYNELMIKTCPYIPELHNKTFDTRIR
jgi:hypothetical protein